MNLGKAPPFMPSQRTFAVGLGVQMPSVRKSSGSPALGIRPLRSGRAVTVMKTVMLLTMALAITTLSLVAAEDAKPKRAKPTAEEIKKYDKDGDGKLNKEERAAFNADKKKQAPAK